MLRLSRNLKNANLYMSQRSLPYTSLFESQTHSIASLDHFLRQAHQPFSTESTAPKKDSKTASQQQQKKRFNQNKRGPGQGNRRNQGQQKNNPWRNAKKGSTKSEQRLENAFKQHRNNNGNSQSNNQSNNNNSQQNRNKQKFHAKKNNNQTQSRFRKTSNNSMNGIEKLREAFMQSLAADRERRQAAPAKDQDSSRNQQSPSFQKNGNNFGNNTNRLQNQFQSSSESRLDQLLRMSRKPNNDNQNQRNNNNYNNSYGNQSFRERNQYRNRNHRNGNYNNNNQNAYQQRGPSEAQLLQKELMKENDFSLKENAIAKEEESKEVLLPPRNLNLSELSFLLRVQKDKLIQLLRDLGESPKADDDSYKVDPEVCELVAMELGLEPIRQKRGKCSMEAAESRMRRQAGESEDGTSSEMTYEDELYQSYPPRPPVVCIMGHVDHGKTTLMDRLRQKAADANPNGNQKKKKKSKKKKKKGKDKDDEFGNVAGTEAGGITQVVSAFQVKLPGTETLASGSNDVDAVTFLDTPGHAAFKAMRQSGSNGADVIVLVVASDDGVSPQTVEIIDMYKSIARAQPGSISMVVAMTKIDKPGINIEESMTRIENQLMEHDIYSERMAQTGSEFDAVPIYPLSGMTGEGLDDLIEGLVLQSEVMDLRADAESRAEGLIIDAKMEKGLGVVADCIIRWGKLEVGDFVVSGVHGGKVRILNDVDNKGIKKASPSQPVRIVGLKTLPKAGDPIVCVKSEEIAKELIAKREALASSSSYRAQESNAKLDVVVTGGASKKGFMANNVLKKYGLDEESVESEIETEESDQIRIPVILKADADGTLAALHDTITAIQHESTLNLCIDPVEVSIGHVTPFDVTVAAESGATIFCFNLKGSKDKNAMSMAAENQVEIRSHDVIYHLLDEAKDVFSEYCPATPVETVHGDAKVQAVFNINNNRDAETVAGLKVNDGRLYLDKKKVADSKTMLECKYRVKRNGEIVADDLKAKSIRKVKEEVTEIRRGEECGLNLLDYTDILEGDVIECYSIEMKKKFV